MKIRNLLKKFNRASLKSKVLISGLLTLAVLSGAAVFAGWSPDRPVFDWNNPAHRQGSLNGPVFNSFINTPYYGDERAFFDAARTDQIGTGNDVFKDVLPFAAQGSREVILRSYVHNDANQTTNGTNLDGAGVAKNTKIRIDLPTGQAKALRARSYVTWDNPAPGYVGEVTDTTELVDNIPFSIQYVPGSAVIYNAAHNSGLALSDTIVTSGAPLGYEQMNGLFPGCFDFQAIVEIKVKVVVPNITINKQVRKAGQDGWFESANVKPGDNVQWLIAVQNNGTTDLNNVQVSDQLPPYVQLVPGSVRYIDAAQDVTQQDGPLFTTGGIDTGTWKPNGGFYVRFDTTAKDDFKGCEVTIRNLAFTKSKQTPNEIQDQADVKIAKDCVPEQPVLSCDLLKAELLQDRTYRFTVNTTAQGGASVRRYFYDFGDSTPVLTTDKNVVEHTFPEEGDFQVGAQVEFSVDSQTQTVNGEACKTVISTKKPPVTPPTEQLPVTGSGSVIGLFAGVSALGVVLHRVWLVRRLG